jgi:hypothetical protein
MIQSHKNTKEHTVGGKIKTAAVILFVITLIPVVITGLYARPGLDDYSFSALSSFSPSADTPIEYYINRSVRYAVRNGGFFDVIGAVGRTVSDNYFGWQGTFSAIAIFSIHPAVLFGADAYPLTMLFTLFALIAATAFLCKNIFKENWLIFSVILLTCSIQWIPHIAQGFFWYNGAMYYTFFYSLMIFNVTLMLKFLRSQQTLLIPVIAVLSFFIGGGNYVTALLNAEIAVLFLAYAVYRKKHSLPFVLFVLTAISGLIISAAAPGNAVRGGVFEDSFSFTGGNLFSTIFFSLAQAVYDIINWLNIGVFVLLIIALPIIWRFVKGSSYSFKYPLAVSAVSFLLFASQNAPPIYAMGFVGDPKLRNIVYFSYILLLFGNTIYWLGSLSKKAEFRIALKKKHVLAVYSVLFLILFTLGAGMRLSPSDRAVVLELERSATTVLTMRDLHAGLPQGFLKEHRARQNQLESSTDSVVTVAAFSYMPLTLIPFQPLDWTSGALDAEITNNPAHWSNRSLAAYYGVRGIIGLPPEKTIAAPRHIEFIFRDTHFVIDAYEMANMHFFRLRDIAYILQYVYNVNSDGGQLVIDTNREYMPVGGELKLTPPGTGLQPSYLKNTHLKADGVFYDIPSYEINGDIFHRDDFLELLGIEIYSLHGVWRFNLNFEEFKIKTADGEYISFPAQRPFIAGNRLLAPVREVFEALGFTVGWDADTESVSLTNADYTVYFALGSASFTVNGTSHALESPALIINGSAFMPVAAVLEHTGYDVRWENDSFTLLLKASNAAHTR